MHSDTSAQSAEVLWTPGPEQLQSSRLVQYQRWLAKEQGVVTSDYADLWRWSVEDIDRFWQSIWSFFDIQADGSREPALGRRTTSRRPSGVNSMRGITGVAASRYACVARAIHPEEIQVRRAKKQGLLAVLPLVVSTALVLSACGGGSDDADNTAQQDPGAVTDTSGVPATDTSGAAAPGTTDTGIFYFGWIKWRGQFTANEKVAILFRLAATWRDKLHDPLRTMETYEEIVAVAPKCTRASVRPALSTTIAASSRFDRKRMRRSISRSRFLP